MKLHTLHWIDVRHLEPIEDEGKTVGFAIDPQGAQELVDLLVGAGLAYPAETRILPTLGGVSALSEQGNGESSSSPNYTCGIHGTPLTEDGVCLKCIDKEQFRKEQAGHLSVVTNHPENPRFPVVPPEPLKKSPDRQRIQDMVGKVKTSLSAEEFVNAIRMKLAGSAPSSICLAVGLGTNLYGGLWSSIKRHIDALQVHPDPEWREVYLAEVAYAIERGKKQ